jgi:hypothetical protein
LEPLEDRCTPSANPVQSLGSLAVADVQHALLHIQIITNKVQTAIVQTEIRLDQQAGMPGNAQAKQATLAALQQQAVTLNSQDQSTDAASFPLLRALVPAAQ